MSVAQQEVCVEQMGADELRDAHLRALTEQRQVIQARAAGEIHKAFDLLRAHAGPDDMQGRDLVSALSFVLCRQNTLIHAMREAVELTSSAARRMARATQKLAETVGE